MTPTREAVQFGVDPGAGGAIPPYVTMTVQFDGAESKPFPQIPHALGSVWTAWDGAAPEPLENPVPFGVVKEHLAIYAGSFDPITNGHLDVLHRARGMFDRIILGIGHNPDKPSLFQIEERKAMAEELVAHLERAPHLAEVSVLAYKGLTVDFARHEGAAALVRGIRNVTDLASECQLAITNRQVADVETVFLVTGEAYAFTSSGLIRQVAGLGADVDRLGGMVPKLVIERLRILQADPNGPLRRMARDGHMD